MGRPGRRPGFASRRRFRSARLTVSVVAAVLAAAGCSPAGGEAERPPSSPSTQPSRAAGAPAVWFQPISTQPPTRSGPYGYVGSTDFQALFDPVVTWPTVLAGTRVVGFSAGWLLAVSTVTLRQVVGFLRAHSLQMEIEAPALQATTACGNGVEGYVPARLSLDAVTLFYLRRLELMGAPVAFIKVDEPYFYGTVTTQHGACRLPVAQTARQVAHFTAVVASVYPHAQVGDVEPLLPGGYTPDAVAAIGRWHAIYRTVTGKAFPFFFDDAYYPDPDWTVTAILMEQEIHREGSMFGMIYHGDAQDVTDAQWDAKLDQRARTFAAANHGQPDYVLFQSWDTHPRHVLPETNPATFTGAIAMYLAGLPWPG